MPYIIQQQTKNENCYFIRLGFGDIVVWGSKPRGAAEFATKDDATAFMKRQLQNFECCVREI